MKLPCYGSCTLITYSVNKDFLRHQFCTLSYWSQALHLSVPTQEKFCSSKETLLSKPVKLLGQLCNFNSWVLSPFLLGLISQGLEEVWIKLPVFLRSKNGNTCLGQAGVFEILKHLLYFNSYQFFQYRSNTSPSSTGGERARCQEFGPPKPKWSKNDAAKSKGPLTSFFFKAGANFKGVTQYLKVTALFFWKTCENQNHTNIDKYIYIYIFTYIFIHIYCFRGENQKDWNKYHCLVLRLQTRNPTWKDGGHSPSTFQGIAFPHWVLEPRSRALMHGQIWIRPTYASHSNLSQIQQFFSKRIYVYIGCLKWKDLDVHRLCLCVCNFQ